MSLRNKYLMGLMLEHANGHLTMMEMLAQAWDDGFAAGELLEPHGANPSLRGPRHTERW